ncbi:MAG TPA: ATP phosphoribosyltransferase regulatory subunit [Casimicrobiaceae bacterium]|jgi:ATP phosphoribosyltransferase regulatory subunit|nr:ATP phosphoribosyltransferase regulatory subunit [Casimicrobiaceae bacterium]
MHNWLLPDAIDDVLPAEAAELEALRRRLLDHFAGRGYRLVRPPLIEHLESLLTGSGRDLELLTFKTVDPQSGRLVGIRADITPQVARIDAHLLNEAGATRLCYAGSVVRAVAEGPGATREVVQVGAELFGVPGTEGDREVIELLASSLATAGLRGLHLDLGHMGVYRALASGAGVTDSGEDGALYEALRTKDAPTVRALTQHLPAAWRSAFEALPQLYGPADEVLREARTRLPDVASIANALDALAALADAAAPLVEALHADLADLRGYHYHNGAIFSVFIEGEPNAIAKGGRYDGIGKAFGRSRPATGFTLDLRQLVDLLARDNGSGIRDDF